jgi:uncharacterized protein with PIN domain
MLEGPPLFSSSIVAQVGAEIPKWWARKEGGMSQRPRVLVDAMLGRLVTYLRMCGYDAVYVPDEGLDGDVAIGSFARAEDRQLLTRDRTLAARTANAVLLDSRDIEDQLAELAAAGFDLELPAEPQRCSTCNGGLTRVAPTEPTPEYAPDPADTDIWRCESCGQHFWKGSHWDDVAGRLAGH